MASGFNVIKGIKSPVGWLGFGKKDNYSKTEASSNNVSNNPNHLNKNGFSAIEEAVRNNDVPRVISAINEGAELNFHDKTGSTPLIQAIKKNNIPIINILLENGADPEFKDVNQRQPFFYIRDGNFEETYKNNARADLPETYVDRVNNLGDIIKSAIEDKKTQTSIVSQQQEATQQIRDQNINKNPPQLKPATTATTRLPTNQIRQIQKATNRIDELNQEISNTNDVMKDILAQQLRIVQAELAAKKESITTPNAPRPQEPDQTYAQNSPQNSIESDSSLNSQRIERGHFSAPPKVPTPPPRTSKPTTTPNGPNATTVSPTQIGGLKH